MSKPKAPAKKKNGYKMPDPLPKGLILQDTAKKQWELGPSIGKGGFGEIYSAKPADSKSNDFPFVIKIEPHDNGPLFVEMHFYTRNCKESEVSAFMNEKKLKQLGMPLFYGSGSHVHKNEKYRFVVMERFAPKDVWKLFLENNKKLPAITVYKLGLQMLSVLEYIHSKGYIHADLKGANILLSLKDPNQAYLVDFGLAGKFTTDSVFKPNPKKMHDGTIEYLSRDAHQGVQTRRGDLEILAFNLIHWLCGKLPWDNLIANPKAVHESKELYMKNISKFLSYCFADNAPSPIKDLLNYIANLKFNQEPDYKKIRTFLLKGLKDSGGTESSPLQFKSPVKRKSTGVEESPKKRGKAAKSSKEPTTPKAKRVKKTNIETSSTKENDEVVKKPVPARRGRRVNTISTIDDIKNNTNDDAMEQEDTQENGSTSPIMNKEMKRIKELAAKRVGSPKKPRTRRIAPKLNKSLDNIYEIDDSAEKLPVSKRALAKAALKN